MDDDKIKAVAEEIQNASSYEELHEIIIDYAKDVLEYEDPVDQLQTIREQLEQARREADQQAQRDIEDRLRKTRDITDRINKHTGIPIDWHEIDKKDSDRQRFIKMAELISGDK